MVTIAIGADHAGWQLKDQVAGWLQQRGLDVLNLGTDGAASVDYPDFGRAVAEAVANGEAAMGILVCGTGLGMSMTANKVDGIRAACVSDSYSAAMAREHNDANVLCFGARVVGAGVAHEIVARFLDTPFAGGRHAARVAKISDASG